MRSHVLGLLGLVLCLSVAEAARADELLEDRTVAGGACSSAQRQGEIEAKQGRLLASWERFDACAKAECADPVRLACAQRRDDIDARVPTVAFAVRDREGRDLEASVSVDGGRPTPVGRTNRLEPGIHEVRWSTPTSPVRAGLELLTVFEGQKNRVVVLAAEGDPPPVVSHESPSKDAWPWVVVGTGGLFVAAATVFELVGLREDSERKALDLTLSRRDLSAAERDSFRSARESHRDAAATNEAVAITVGIVGIAAIASGITWALVRDRSGRTAKSQVVPMLAGTGVGFAF